MNRAGFKKRDNLFDLLVWGGSDFKQGLERGASNIAAELRRRQLLNMISIGSIDLPGKLNTGRACT